MAVSSECSGLDALWIDGGASLEFSSLEACKKGFGKIGYIPEIHGDSQIKDSYQLTNELCRSGEGLLCLEALLAAIFFTAVLVLVGTRGAAGVEAALRLGADFCAIG